MQATQEVANAEENTTLIVPDDIDSGLLCVGTHMISFRQTGVSFKAKTLTECRHQALSDDGYHGGVWLRPGSTT